MNKSMGEVLLDGLVCAREAAEKIGEPKLIDLMAALYNVADEVIYRGDNLPAESPKAVELMEILKEAKS
ncbi:MAG: hypothetical protein JKY45_13065 [Emcibacter sp.]|nr:hypothetical protein [Emcibacter sp.]